MEATAETLSLSNKACHLELPIDDENSRRKLSQPKIKHMITNCIFMINHLKI